MNKLKLWEIESLVEGECERSFSVPLCLENFAVDEVRQNYKNGVSQFSENFFLVEKFSFEKSENPVFENSLNDDRSGENKKEFFGLAKQQLMFINKKPVYLIDNHNKSLYPFLEISKILGENISIVHIDAHRDDAKFQDDYPVNIDWKNINWCLEKTRVSDYLDLGEKSGLIGEVFSITQSREFKNFLENEQRGLGRYSRTGTQPLNTPDLSTPYILNLDIDIFGPEGEAVDLELKIKTIVKAWSGATAIVIATSPGYISADNAEEIIEIFVKNMKK